MKSEHIIKDQDKILNNQNQKMNNMANYVDFEGTGKTNKKISQSPGGSSGLSLAWGNQKTDYGPPRQSRSNQQRPPNYPPIPQKRQELSRQYQQQYGQYSNNNDIQRNSGGYQQPLSNYPPQQNSQMNKPENIYGAQNVFSSYDSTSNYKDYTQGTGQSPNSYGKYYGNKYNAQQELDRALLEREVMKPSSQSNNQARSCIKINGPPKPQFSIGDNNYNYWRDNGMPQKRNNKSGSYRKIEADRTVQRQPSSYQNLQKPSIRINNPPGGKSNFSFG